MTHTSAITIAYTNTYLLTRHYNLLSLYFRIYWYELIAKNYASLLIGIKNHKKIVKSLNLLNFVF